MPALSLAVLGLLFIVGLLAPATEFFADPEGYLILHMATEFASIAIALMVFALSLHLRGEHSSRSLSILGAACLSVALIDFAHLLSYAGMPFWVTESSPEKAINFWLPARAIMAAALLLVAILPERRIGRAGRWGLPLAGAGIALAVYWVVLFHSDWLPRTFIEGEGLTTFKVAAEYVIAGVCVAAGVLMWRRSARARDSLLAWQWLAAAAFTAAMSELFFTLYSSVTDTANLLGHLYKVAAFLMIYRAVFAQGIDRPQRDLARERGLLRTVVDSVPDQIQLQDQQGATVLENRAHPIALDRTGDAPGDWTDGRALPLRQESETGPDGQERTYDVVEANAMSESGDPIGTVVVRRDITEVVEYHRRLERLSNFDPITGLANQNALLSDLSQRCRDGGEPFCLARVFVTDLSGVEAAESSLVRDEAAVQIAQRIRAAADPDCVTARLGTSEFAVVAPAATHHAAADLAESLVAALSAPLDEAAGGHLLQARVGIALYPTDAHGAEALLSASSAALGKAIQSPGPAVQFFTREIQQRATERARLLADLRRALDGDELLLHYQPQVNLRDRSYLGVEALVRWQHPELGLLPPDRFIDIAERGGLIHELGRWVLHRALDDAAAWREAGRDPVRVAVNISATQWGSPTFVRTVLDALHARGLPAEVLDLELTETVAVQSQSVTRASLQRLSEAGVSVSLDDFGIGQSSLAAVADFFPDRIKIDRSFIARLVDDPRERELVTAMIRMADSLGCLTLAEGIEHDRQLSLLREMGCREGQGYLFDHPMPADEVRSRMPSLTSGMTPPVPRPLVDGLVPSMLTSAPAPPRVPRQAGGNGTVRTWDTDRRQSPADLLASPELKALLGAFFDATGVPMGLEAPVGNWVVALGWEPICTDFHRSQPASAEACEDCGLYMTQNLSEGHYIDYLCVHGLVDVAYPIVVNGERIGNFRIGQFVHDEPDRERFRQQARRYGYDEDAYLSALDEVKVVPPERVDQLMGFFTRLIGLVTTLAEATQGRVQAEAELAALAGAIDSAVEERSKELVGHMRTLRAEAARDELTGALNRSAVASIAAQEMQRVRNRDAPLSLAMIDVDHFKEINDQRGHATGDAVLRAMAEAVRGELRGRDVLARLGGDEFLILLPHTGLSAAQTTCERIRQTLAEDPGLPTLSIGVVEWEGESFVDLVARADEAMYRAKGSGRDTVVALPGGRSRSADRGSRRLRGQSPRPLRSTAGSSAVAGDGLR